MMYHSVSDLSVVFNIPNHSDPLAGILTLFRFYENFLEM